MYVNDIEDCIPHRKTSETCKYADDCTRYQLVPKVSSCSMQDAICDMEVLAQDNKMEFNGKKTKDMWISFKKSCPSPLPFRVGDTEIERLKSCNLLDTCLQNDLK